MAKKQMKMTKIEKRKIFIMKCLIVLMAISSTLMLYNGYNCEIANSSSKAIWERKCLIYLTIDWIIIIIYFAIGHSIKDLKKKLK